MIGIISDIHGRSDALEAVLSEMPDSVDTIVCCGDIVGYGPHPRKCVERIRNVADVVVGGNHDRYVSNPRGGRLLDSIPRYTQKALTRTQIKWLNRLPKTSVVENYLITHSHPKKNSRSIHPDDFPEVTNHLDGYDGLIFGHTHRQVESNIRGYHLLNPGCVGKPRPSNFKPPTCVGLRPEYAVLDPTDNSASFHRVDYGIRDLFPLSHRVPDWV